MWTSALMCVMRTGWCSSYSTASGKGARHDERQWSAVLYFVMRELRSFVAAFIQIWNLSTFAAPSFRVCDSTGSASPQKEQQRSPSSPFQRMASTKSPIVERKDRRQQHVSMAGVREDTMLGAGSSSLIRDAVAQKLQVRQFSSFLFASMGWVELRNDKRERDDASSHRRWRRRTRPVRWLCVRSSQGNCTRVHHGSLCVPCRQVLVPRG